MVMRLIDESFVSSSRWGKAEKEAVDNFLSGRPARDFSSNLITGKMMSGKYKGMTCLYLTGNSLSEGSLVAVLDGDKVVFPEYTDGVGKKDALSYRDRIRKLLNGNVVEESYSKMKMSELIEVIGAEKGLLDL